MKIPNKGMGKDELFKQMEAYRAEDMDWRSGRTWGYIYDAGKEIDKVGKEAYLMFLGENALDPTVFPSLLRFETEVVAMAAAHVNGDENVVGNLTTGGTESILMAIKSARDLFRQKKPEIREPEMVLPTTAHAAFQKGAHYFDVKPVLVPVDPETFKADVDALRQAVTPNTILLVGSAPSYAHGVIDPIRELGQVALDHELLFHVDACMGGFLLPYYRRLGESVPDFDFSVPGVTSLSMDLHKYAYTPKGASLILYRDKEIRKAQLFACARWPGYTMVNTTAGSTKSGGPLAAAWATLHFVGDEGYMELARKKIEATRAIAEGIEAMEDLRLMVKPEMCLVAFTSDTVSVFHVIDEMKERGWYIQPQLAFESSQTNVHVSINASNVAWVGDFLADLEVCVEKAKTMKSGEVAAMVEETFSNINPEELTDEMFSNMLAMAGIQGVQLPERMADINEIMNTLSPEMRERLLIEFVNDLFQYRK